MSPQTKFADLGADSLDTVCSLTDDFLPQHSLPFCNATEPFPLLREFNLPSRDRFAGPIGAQMVQISWYIDPAHSGLLITERVGQFVPSPAGSCGRPYIHRNPTGHVLGSSQLDQRPIQFDSSNGILFYGTGRDNDGFGREVRVEIGEGGADLIEKVKVDSA